MRGPETRLAVGEADRGKRLDRWLAERIPGLSRTRIRAAIPARVRVSWTATAQPATPVVPGGMVFVAIEPLDEPAGPLPQLTVLARGTGWFAIDKPAGMPVHPVRSARLRTVTEIVRQLGLAALPRPVHRLDRETSGVLLFAEDAATARAAGAAFACGAVDKEYFAIVRGRPARARGTIDLPIGRAAGSAVAVRLRAGVPDGRAAVTHWEVERLLREAAVLRIRPETGRRHQVRVHLEAIGHPILGDPLYGRPDRDYLALVRGDPDPRRSLGDPERQMLHCGSVRLDLPGACLAASSPRPPDFEAWCAVLS